jgi:hypothetical protein
MSVSNLQSNKSNSARWNLTDSNMQLAVGKLLSDINLKFIIRFEGPRLNLKKFQFYHSIQHMKELLCFTRSFKPES